MRYLTLLLLYFLTIGCAQLTTPQEQPIKKMENDIYFTTCSGFVEGWGACFEKAKRTCLGGYKVIREFRDSSGIHRELTFQCKK